MAFSTLKKIICSKTNDAIILAANFEKITIKDIEKLNLFQITQIKKTKDGGFEFYFIDKIKAIETLLLFLEKLDKKNNSTNITSFLNALTTNSNN